MDKKMEKSLSKNEGIDYSPSVIISIGFILSLSIGFIDIMLSILSAPSGFSSFQLILPPLMVMTSIFFLIYIFLWFLVISHIGRFLKLETIPLALSLALFLGTLFTLVLLNDPIHLLLPLSNLFKFFILLFISLLISIGIYFVTKAVTDMSDYRNIAVIFGLAIPFILAEMVVFVWLQKYRIDTFISIPSFLACAGYILILMLTVGLFYRIGQKVRVAGLLAVSMSFVFLSLLITLIAIRGFKASSEILKESNHPIKNVILITVDTLRADVLSPYNKQGVSTPHINQLAGDGLLFTRAISPSPWTLPSLASIMTGLSPSVHMVTGSKSKLIDTLPALAEYTRDAGYFTTAIVHNDYLRPATNLSQGFLEYNFLQNPSFGDSYGVRLLQGLLPKHFPPPPWPSTNDHTRLAINWLESNYERDFFLWLHYLDPHAPYTPPMDYLPKKEPPPGIGTSFTKQREVISGTFVPSLTEREWIKDLYDGEVRYVDENVGKLLDTLKRLNQYDKSLIIITSDHGEEFWEHSRHGHGHTLYNELLWVPLIIKLPQSASKGQINQIVSTQSIMPTILDLCGIYYESDYLSSGSLSPLWKFNPHSFDGQPIISTGQILFDNQESVIFDRLKYIRSPLTNREELYDLVRDPEEQISVVPSFPDKVRRARNILREHNEKAKKLKERYLITSKEETEFDTETMQRLKALGYIQ
ncbi:MAG: sulfatase-like hydrolase/transferase [Planctomycetota bacterium]